MSAAEMNSEFKNVLLTVRHNFAKQLRKALKNAYGGKMPSLSRIGRDLALRSPILSQVSNEAIRKWLIGTSIPSAIAILTLAEWLGSEILIPLMGEGRGDNKKRSKPNNQSDESVELDAWIQPNRHSFSSRGNKQSVINQEMANLLQKLSAEDHALVVSLIKALSAKQINKDGLVIKNNALRQALDIPNPFGQ